MVAHAVPEEFDIRVTAYDNELFAITQIQRAENDDLAVMTFDVEGEATCPYAALKLGDSERVKIDDAVKMAGYPERAGAARLVLQFPSGTVTNIESPPLPDGYAISYDMTTVGGMSGAPVVAAKGKIIGIHGLTDSELVSLGRSQQSSLSDTQKDEIKDAEERVEGLARINHFKWGIPMRTFMQQREALLSGNTSVVKTDDTVVAEDPAEKISALISEADERSNKKDYEEALALYEEALALDSNQEKAWFGKGFSLHGLGRYEDAIASYDKAIEIDPDYADAWNNRGLSLAELDRDEDAIASYDKAVEIDADYADAWYARGNSLRELGRYEDAIASYDKVIEIDADYSFAWNNRGWALEQLNRKEDALNSYEKAVEADANNKNAVNNLNRLRNELN